MPAVVITGHQPGRQHNHNDPGAKEFLCGWFAAFAETFVTYPLNKIIFRQQLHGIPAALAAGQLRSEGFRFLYRGILPPLMQKTCARSIMFGCYERYRQLLGGAATGLSYGQRHALAAFLAGSTEALLCPFERMQTILQSTAYHGRYTSTLHLIASLRPHGYREYYRGMSAIVARNGCANTLFFGAREPLRRLFADDDTTDPWRRFGAAFVSGAILGGALSTLFYPINVVKTRQQRHIGGPHRHIHVVAREIWLERERSVLGFYRGVHLNFLRAILTWGLTNLLYDLSMHLLTDYALVGSSSGSGGGDDRRPEQTDNSLSLFDAADLLTKIEFVEEKQWYTWPLE